MGFVFYQEHVYFASSSYREFADENINPAEDDGFGSFIYDLSAENAILL